jgi:hypothetical protein
VLGKRGRGAGKKEGREREEEARRQGVLIPSSGQSAARIPAASGDDDSSTELFHCSQEEDNRFCKKPPGLWGFLENFKNSTLFNSFCCFANFWKFQII